MMSQRTGLFRVLSLLGMGCTNSVGYQTDPGAAGGADAGERVDAGDGDAARDAGRDAWSPPEPGGACLGPNDCADGLSCVGPEERLCGVRPQEECEFARDCVGEFGANLRCHAQPDPCSPDGIGSACAEACEGAGCEVGFVCQNGSCVPQRCNDGFQCSPTEECDASSIDGSGPAHAVTHGCVPIACTSDEPCPEDAVCVNGRCQTGAGTCSLPPP
jgi:hypothetical protein